MSLPVVQVEEDTEELRKTFRGEEEAERPHGTSSRSRTQRRTFHSSWEETHQKFLTAQELGASFIRTVATVTTFVHDYWVAYSLDETTWAGLTGPFTPTGCWSRSDQKLQSFGPESRVLMCVSAQMSNLQTLLLAARRRLERLNAIIQEVNEQQRLRQVHIQQLQVSCRRYQDRLQKVQKHHLDIRSERSWFWPSTEVLVLCVSDPAGPEQRLRAVGLLYYDGPGFRGPDLQAAGTLQPG